MSRESEKYVVLVSRILSGEASAAEQIEFDEWLAASEQNRKLFAQYDLVWGIEDNYTKAGFIDRAVAWKKITTDIERIENPESLRQSSNIRRLYFSISGVAALLLVFLGIYFLLLNEPNNIILTYSSADQLSEPIQLPDGTIVYLKENASLSYPESFTGKQRRVQLSGNAFFEVSYQTDHPFVVELESLDIKVLGTSFNIAQHTGKYSDIAVISGSIHIQTKMVPAKEAILIAGQKGIFMYPENDLVIEDITDFNFMAWKTGRLEFDQTSLPEVFKVIEATYNISIIEENDLTDLKLTARFSNENPENIFKTIEMLFNLQIEHNGSLVRVHRNF